MIKEEGELYFRFKLFDKQTKITDYTGWDSYYTLIYSWKIWFYMNDFIVKTIDVWKEHPTRETTIDYRGK